MTNLLKEYIIGINSNVELELSIYRNQTHTKMGQFGSSKYKMNLILPLKSRDGNRIAPFFLKKSHLHIASTHTEKSHLLS